ncbi:MAG TPA: GNAT family N-acetyltransferase [Symbiobacteriaceae bacterium]|nr:GNAT family N-acetyltransferase [Symbiobacteriaceae bacterium]
MIDIRQLQPHEYEKVREIDVSETGSMIYRAVDGQLVEEQHEWRRPPWTEARYADLIDTWKQAVADGGFVLGAFDGDLLVGEAVFRPNLTESMAQLESLHVSQNCRRQGAARRLAAEVIRLARESGAEALYVSATPTRSAVGFYRSVGFEPTAAPHPLLFELEPEDIHMTMSL